jgi:hypothetical protein
LLHAVSCFDAIQAVTLMRIAARGARFLFAMVLLAISTAVPAAEPTTRLTGTVLDGRGKALADVPVGIALTEEVQARRRAAPVAPAALVARTHTDWPCQ